jgi:hypothetical protein
LGNGTYVLLSLGLLYAVLKLKKAYIPKIMLTSVMMFLVLQLTPVSASNIPPNPPSSGHGSSGDQPPGGGAPLGDGVLILLLAAASYAGIKYHSHKSGIRLEE